MKHRCETKDGPKDVEITPVKAIRLHCLECLGFSSMEVVNCSRSLCPLFPYRLGRNPAREGLGNKNPDFSKKHE